MNIFKISKKSIGDFKNEKFNIPSYQRPYCWGKDEIEKLLNDIKENIEEDIYFIGNVISSKHHDTDCYDLIDGQQRFTTLWVLCLYLSPRYDKISLKSFCESDDNTRLSFSIRDKTNEYFNELLTKIDVPKFWNIPHSTANKYISYSSEIDLAQNKTIFEAFCIIDDWFNDGDKSYLIDRFAPFIWTKLKFEFLIAPQGVDENSLFIQINTHGVQLQHYDILKAELLNKLSDNERHGYAKKWDDTSYMFAKKEEDKEEDNNQIDSKEEQTLRELIKNSDDYKKTTEKEDIKKHIDYPFIFNFNVLLLHTLFIFIKRQDTKTIKLPDQFNSEKLLQIFKEFRQKLTPDIAKQFIDLISELKQLVIENIIVHGDGELKLYSNFMETESPIDKFEEVEQLQRMLYHSVSNENRFFWLGIYLDFLLNNKDLSNKNKFDHLDHLEKIDNYLSLGQDSFEEYKSYFDNKTIEFSKDKINTFTAPDLMTFGSVKRYWFYKLEYLLWKKEKNMTRNIISRNSKEHILVQKDREKYKKQGIDIDQFGNLVLISVSENSHFSDKNILKKFNYILKLSNAPYKLISFFEKLEEYKLIKDEYDDTEYSQLKIAIEEHQKEMLALIREHYSS